MTFLNEKLFDSKNRKLKELIKIDEVLDPAIVLQVIKTVTTIRNNLRTAIDNLVSPLDTIEQDFQVIVFIYE